jgi:hypothetical protein
LAFGGFFLPPSPFGEGESALSKPEGKAKQPKAKGNFLYLAFGVFPCWPPFFLLPPSGDKEEGGQQGNSRESFGYPPPQRAYFTNN